MQKKRTLDEVRVIFAEGGCEFVDDNYVDAHHPHNYRCSCGRESKISLNHFNSGRRCSDCGGNKKKTLEEVRAMFAEGGCEFLDDSYVNCDHPHNYRCSCGREAKICLRNFKRGSRCSDCGGNKKKTLNEVRAIFAEGGCEFLDDSYIKLDIHIIIVVVVGENLRLGWVILIVVEGVLGVVALRSAH